ncbi:hypothetical protein ENSA5_27260 [Enhygromyxa salina]|uniref:Lipoprotein n=1 Tax=Enhygromyxa salina TaxID=215803 RepID=A0A2S9Y7G9_9BACT|nr:hypothetical protein [Enhygromyxa salina]PRQ01044.1 hypothetical protein ENSA5_27260 [Enhygromyxa salina]
MPRVATALARLALSLAFILGVAACAGRNAGPPPYKPAAELDQCEPGECVEAKLSFRRWANAEFHRGRMPYHCDPGSELDGRPNPAVTRMIFVVHGVVGTTPEALAQLHVPPGLVQLRSVTNALRRAEQLDPELDRSSIAIVAPTFQRTTQWQPYTDEDKRVWTWDRSTYNIGTLAARDPRGHRQGRQRVLV